MKKLMFISILSALAIMINAQVSDSLNFIALSPAEFREEIRMVNNAMIIDVREFFEYRRSRLDKAINISLKSLELAADTLNKYHHYFLYCTTDFRSQKAARFMISGGFSRVYFLEGGIAGWRKSGFPVDTKKLRRKKD